MPAPSFVFGFLLSTLYGASFHFLLGGDARRLALFLLASWTGFALGQISGDLFDVEAGDIGQLHFLIATIGAYVALLIVMLMTRRDRGS